MTNPEIASVDCVTLKGAETALRGALQMAQGLGVAVTVAVVDRGGHLLALARDEKANLVSLDLAIGKAYSALVMQTSTMSMANLVQPGEPVFHIDVVHQPRPLVAFGGGVPMGSPAVGAIGVSGGSPEQDDAIARAGLAALS